MFPRPDSYSHSDQLSLHHTTDPEKIQYKAIYNLNICGMALTKGFDFPNNLKFLLDFIKASLPQPQNRPGQQPTNTTPLISF